LASKAVGRSQSSQHAHTRGVRTDASSGHQVVTREFRLQFATAPESVGLAQVLLAQLGYLPLQLPENLVPVAPAATTHRQVPLRRSAKSARSVTAPSSRPHVEASQLTESAGSTDSAAKPTAAGAAAQTAAATAADPATALVFRYASTPASVQALWRPGVDSTMTQGAIVQFERVHGLEDGSYPPYGTTLTAPVWSALLQASLAGTSDPHPYSVAEVSEAQPEQLTVWSDGATALTTLVNTGVPGGATPTGSFFVYLRYTEQTMRGYTTTGQPYVYPDVPDVNYFSGNFAIHGFGRASYGFPQSQGCVEVPLDEAPVVFANLHYGSLVVIT